MFRTEVEVGNNDFYAAQVISGGGVVCCLNFTGENMIRPDAWPVLANEVRARWFRRS